MPLQQGRICPICFKENLCYLGDHLRQVHQLSRSKKKTLVSASEILQS